MRTKNWPDTVHAKKKNKAQLKFERFKKHEVFHISQVSYNYPRKY